MFGKRTLLGVEIPGLKTLPGSLAVKQRRHNALQAGRWNFKLQLKFGHGKYSQKNRPVIFLQV